MIVNLAKTTRELGFKRVEDFAIACGIKYDTLKNWSEQHPYKLEAKLEQFGWANPIKVMALPKGAQFRTRDTNTFYKYGSHGYIFMWTGYEWKRSSKDSSEVNGDRMIKI